MLYEGHRTPGGERQFYCRIRISGHQRARKFFGGGGQGTNLEHLQGGDERLKVTSDREIASLEKHGMYELVPITAVPNGRKVVGTRWVYKIKADEVYKGRLVVLEWSQVRGIDCGGTFAPVCSLQSIRIVLAIAAELDYEVYMLDVQTAFLDQR